MGLIKIKKKNIPLLNLYLESKNKQINKLKLNDLLKFFYDSGLKFDVIDSYGDWAEINDYKDISNFISLRRYAQFDQTQPVLEKVKKQEFESQKEQLEHTLVNLDFEFY